jgi:hypothetical protein
MNRADTFKINTVAAIRANFDTKFPDLTGLPKGKDRLPGREFGDFVVEGLRKRGFQASDNQCEEPFFVTWCRSGDWEYKVFCYLYTPDEASPVWVVECPATIGFWGKLTGKSEERELSAVLAAIDDTLKSDARVKETRWFADLPAEPFSAKKYAISPQAGFD